MFPSQADILFWQSKRAPRWALEAGLKVAAPSELIDQCVNAHAGLKPTSGELAAGNLIALIRSVERRGGNVPAFLAELTQDPGWVVNPAKRASLARKWLRRSS